MIKEELLSKRYFDKMNNEVSMCGYLPRKVLMYGEICRLEGELTTIPVLSKLTIKKISYKLGKIAKENHL